MTIAGALTGSSMRQERRASSPGSGSRRSCSICSGERRMDEDQGHSSIRLVIG